MHRAPCPVPGVFLNFGVCFALGLACSHADTAEPKTQRSSHARTVLESLERVNRAEEPVVVEWVKRQNQAARSYLEAVPARGALKHQLATLFASEGADYSSIKARGTNYFVLRKEKSWPQKSALLLMPSLTNFGASRVILDSTSLTTSGTLCIEGFEPSPDGKLVAIFFSESDRSKVTLRVHEVASGKQLPDKWPDYGFGSTLAWSVDNKGFFYAGETASERSSRTKSTNVRPGQRVFYHRIGDAPSGDRYEVGREFPGNTETRLEVSADGRYLLASVLDTARNASLWLRGPTGEWKQIAESSDRIGKAEFGRDPIYIEWPKDESLYLLSNRDTPRGRILRLPLSDAELNKAVEIIPEGTNTIDSFLMSASGIYIAELSGGASSLRFHAWNSKNSEDQESDSQPTNDTSESANPNANKSDRPADSGVSREPQNERESSKDMAVPVNGIYSVEEMICPKGDELLVRTVGFLQPPGWQAYDPSTSPTRLEQTALRGNDAPDFQDVESVRISIRSRDRNEIPLYLLRRKGMRMNGGAPTILTGPGEHGSSTTRPRFDLTHRVWFDQGGLIAFAQVRDDGERGSDLPQAGQLIGRQNALADFIDCAEFLIRSGYTSPERLAIQGEERSGWLVAAAVTRRPDLFRAMVCKSGIFDLRGVRSVAGNEPYDSEPDLINSSEESRAVRAYSPYHQVQDGRSYPGTLLLTGEQGAHGAPPQSWKMAARLQAATRSTRPVLVRTSLDNDDRTNSESGHRMEQLIDIYSFLFDQLGVEHSSVFRGPLIGAVTPHSARAKVKLARSGQVARLVLSTSPLLTRPRYFGPQKSATNEHNLVSFELRDLKPDTQYYYAIEVDGRLDRSRRGQFRTFPAGAASFQFAFASCARTASTNDVFDVIRHNQPLFYMNIGDFHYLDLTNSQVERFRAAYDLVLSSPPQAELYRSTAFFYMWDDHDFGGNNANRRATSQQAVRTAYQEYMPHYPLPGGGGNSAIYQSFAVGRVKFIVTDLRSERDSVTNRDDAEKSMMGPQQKQWFKNELLAANGRYPLIFWVTTVPWLGERGTNYYPIATNLFGYVHHLALTNSTTVRTNRDRGSTAGSRRGFGDDQDHWSAFSTERREICDFIKSNHIRGLAILHGDAHMLAADDGRHGDYATEGGLRIPVMCGGPLDQSPSIKGGPYSQGIYRVRPGEGCFGLVSIDDLGDRIAVRYSGRNNHNEEKIALRFEVPGNSSAKNGFTNRDN